MEELIKQITQKTGISADKAKSVIDMVMKFVSDKLPAPLAEQVKPYVMKGDFAAGERTMPPSPEGPDFARGGRTMPPSPEGPDFARGGRTVPPSTEVGDFATGEHTLPPVPEAPVHKE